MNKKLFVLIVATLILITSLSAAYAQSCGGTTACVCGDDLVDNRTLNASDNLTDCSGTGIYIDDDYITLDCDGYHITGTGSGSGIVSSFDNVTIKNCIVSGFDIGIELYGLENNTVYNNTVYNNSASFHLSQLTAEGWEELYTPFFMSAYSTQAFRFNPIANNVKLRIVQKDKHFADVEQAKLMACGEEILPEYAIYTETGESVLGDIMLIDYNVVIAHEKEIEISWNTPESCSEAMLYLTANEYGPRSPFRSEPMSYSIGENPGTLEVDGILTETDGIATPVEEIYWVPSTGHPAGYVYVYASDDAENLYVSLDVTVDNTNEAEDWAELVIGDKAFRVDDLNEEWGTCKLGYTSTVSYKHQACEFKIPKSEVGYGDVDFVLRYYGTVAITSGGIVLRDIAHYNTIIDNTVYDNEYGLLLDDAYYNSFEDNNVSSNNYAGLYLLWSNYNNFTNIYGGGVIGDSTAYGIYLYDSEFNKFDNVNAGDVTAAGGVPSAYGLYLSSNADNNTFNKVTVGDVFGNGTNAYGIRISCADGNNFTNTKFGDIESPTSNAYGLYMECGGSPDYNTFTNTQMGDIKSDGNTYGIYMREESGYNTINKFTTGNLYTSDEDINGMYLYNLDTVNYFSTITFGNLQSDDDARVLYIYNSDHQEIDGFTAGTINSSDDSLGLYLYSSDYNKINDFKTGKLTGVDRVYAAYFLNSDFNNLTNSELTNAEIGLVLSEITSSLNNTIEHNIIKDNSEWNMWNYQLNNVSAEHNCWGVRGAIAVDKTIQDDDENATLYGEVDFEPFDTSCVGGAVYDELPWPTGGGGGGTVPTPPPEEEPPAPPAPPAEEPPAPPAPPIPPEEEPPAPPAPTEPVTEVPEAPEGINWLIPGILGFIIIAGVVYYFIIKK